MLHAPVAAAATTNVRDSESASRHRASASLGKTHFKLAPGLLPATSASSSKPSTTYYNERWQQWMSSPSSWASSSTYSSSPSSVQSTSYDSSWARWMKSHSPGTTATTTAAAQSSTSTPAALFEDVPRDAMLPIMSRLPWNDGDAEDAIAAEPTKSGQLDYLSAKDGVEGLHPEETVAATPELHYTRARLPDIDEDSYHLWKSLHSLRAVSDDYSEGYGNAGRRGKKSNSSNARMVAPHPISEDMDETQCPAFADSESLSSQRALALVKKLFNWDQLPELPEDVEYTWYGVAFRSKRRPGSESVNFYEDDRRSHEEAVNSGGLLMYWYGRPSLQTGHNLATCIWTSRHEAIKASSLPLHARAAVHSKRAYESFELSRYALRKVKGETKLRLEEWVE